MFQDLRRRLENNEPRKTGKAQLGIEPESLVYRSIMLTTEQLIILRIAYSSFQWFILLVMKKNNYMFIRKYLKISEKMDTAVERKLSVGEKKLCRRFAEHYLR